MTDQRRRVIVRRIFVAQSVDVLTYAVFMVLALPSIHAERNPIILFVASLGGVTAILALKLGISGLIEWRAHRPVSRPVTRRAYWPVWTIMASAAAASGIAGAGFNIAALLRLQG